MSLAVAIIAATSYIVFSLLSKRPPIDMDKLLHRGEYKVEDYGHNPGTPAAAPGAPLPIRADMPLKEKIYRRLGINDDFTKGDIFIYFFQTGFTLFFFFAFIIGSILAVTIGISDDNWIKWWAFMVSAIVILAIGTTIWFLIGGFKDLGDLIRTLKNVDRDLSDDGSVRGKEHLQEND